jgi:hypothetical protein
MVCERRMAGVAQLIVPDAVAMLIHAASRRMLLERICRYTTAAAWSAGIAAAGAVLIHEAFHPLHWPSIVLPLALAYACVPAWALIRRPSGASVAGFIDGSLGGRGAYQLLLELRATRPKDEAVVRSFLAWLTTHAPRGQAALRARPRVKWPVAAIVTSAAAATAALTLIQVSATSAWHFEANAAALPADAEPLAVAGTSAPSVVATAPQENWDSQRPAAELGKRGAPQAAEASAQSLAAAAGDQPRTAADHSGAAASRVSPADLGNGIAAGEARDLSLANQLAATIQFAASDRHRIEPAMLMSSVGKAGAFGAAARSLSGAECCEHGPVRPALMPLQYLAATLPGPAAQQFASRFLAGRHPP